jgi:hypothetical protein
MSVRPRPTQAEFFEDSSLLRPSVEAPAIRLVDLRNDQFPSWRHSLGNLDPLGSLGRLDPLAYARYLITFALGLAVALAWESNGGATREAAALKAISLDRDAVRQSIERIATSVAASQDEMRRSIERSIELSIDRLAAGQAQTEREISDMQTVEHYLLDRISTLPPRPASTTVSKPVPRSPQVPIQLTPPTSP